MSQTPRISSKLLWGVGLAAALLLLFRLWPSPEKSALPTARADLQGKQTEPFEPSPSLPPREVAPLPQAQQVYIEGEGLATVHPITEADHVPPPIDALPSVEDLPPLPEELPQTPAWRLEKVERMTELMTRRVETLEEEAKAASAQGKQEEAARKQVLATRLRERLPALKAEAEELRKQIAAE